MSTQTRNQTEKTPRRRFRGGDVADPGIYFDRRELAFCSLDEEGPLPGGLDAEWRRVPALFLLLAAPLVSIAYVVFLPLVGFVMLAGVLGQKLGELGARAAAALVPVLRPAWQPARAFLSHGRPKTEGAAEETATDEWAEAARREAAADAEGEESEEA